MVILGGGELFTGNTLFVASAKFEDKASPWGKGNSHALPPCSPSSHPSHCSTFTRTLHNCMQIKMGDLIKNWFWAYAGNFVGSLAMVAAVVYSGSMAGNMMPVNAAVAKCSLPLGVAFMRAVLANWWVHGPMQHKKPQARISCMEEVPLTFLFAQAARAPLTSDSPLPCTLPSLRAGWFVSQSSRRLLRPHCPERCWPSGLLSLPSSRWA